MSAKIKVSEIFYSLQGEARFMGVPSVFLRTFGCNFTCSGFGMPRGERSTERDKVEVEKYASYKDLPLVHTGCDSYASWDPRFKHLSPVLTVEAIVDEIERLLPGGKFSRDKHLVITGGEPLLGWQKSYPALLEEFDSRGMNLTHLTFETNGTQTLDTNLATYLVGNIHDVTFSVSAKLPISGESWDDAIKPNTVRSYFSAVGHEENYAENVYLKFVIATLDDFKDAQRAIEEYRYKGVDVPVYLMACGGTVETYNLTERQVADIARDNGLRFSPRLQIPLYKNAWGT